MTEIRESIEIENYTTAATVMVSERIINLSGMVAHQMIHTDFFIDNPFSATNADVIEVIVLPQPLITTDALIDGTIDSTPTASNDNVLFKAVLNKTRIGPGPSDIGWQVLQEFPNAFLGASPTFRFYNDKLYYYIIFHAAGGVTIQDWRCTFYTALQPVKVSMVTKMMGRQKEYFDSQVGRIMTTGRLLGPANLIGQYFPLYAYGGIRPERMLNAQSFANYFLQNIADRDEELMTNPNALRSVIAGARAMQPNMDAYGSNIGLPVGDVPDWVRFGLNEGLVAGPVRKQWPPLKFADSGNTRMF